MNIRKIILYQLLIPGIFISCSFEKNVIADQKDLIPAECSALIWSAGNSPDYNYPFIIINDGLYMYECDYQKIGNQGKSIIPEDIYKYIPVSVLRDEYKSTINRMFAKNDIQLTLFKQSKFKIESSPGNNYRVFSFWHPRTGDGYKLINLYVSNYIAVKGFRPTEIVFYVNGHLLSENEVSTYKKLRKQDLRHIKINHDPQTGRVDVYVTTTSKIS